MLCVRGSHLEESSLSAGLCVRRGEQCPREHHPENEPEICRGLGFPAEYHELCVPYPGAHECVQKEDQCPKGTHAEDEPQICRRMGWPRNAAGCVQKEFQCPKGARAEYEPKICRRMAYPSHKLLCVTEPSLH
ncbi:hypothetical protein BGZ73_007675 [Actinomortierella ambigua]|nr:hypothetical protein BGZ73_007675 [Actinomortierella ambigua]